MAMHTQVGGLERYGLPPSCRDATGSPLPLGGVVSFGIVLDEVQQREHVLAEGSQGGFMGRGVQKSRVMAGRQGVRQCG